MDKTLPGPAENLACDEALLEQLESAPHGDVLRFWESTTPFVVVGYSNKVAGEVNLPACQKRGVPVLRRCSGGGTVVQGPGCLNYTLVLRLDHRPQIQTITDTNRYILEQHRDALAPLLEGPVRARGQSDLTWRGRKISGNAQRRKRHHLLFHGTFLLALDLNLIGELLPLPSRQPDYRQNRPHDEFLANLPLSAEAVKTALRRKWRAEEASPEPPHEHIASLVRNKYARDDWNLRF